MTSDKRPSKQVRIIGYTLLGFVFLVLILILLELIYRQVPEYGRPGYEYDPVLLYRLKRNLVADKSYAMGKVPNKDPFKMIFNKYGFRADAFNPTVSKEGLRLMFLGDSYTAGLDYPGDDIFTNKIKEQVNKSASSTEVLNASCPAWSFDQYYLYWTTEGKNFEPDYLLVMISPNDIRETYNKKIFQINEKGELLHNEINYPMKERVGWWLATRSSFYQYLQKKVFYTKYGDFFRVFEFFPVNYGKEDADNWDLPIFMKKPFREVTESYDLAGKILHALKESCHQNGTQLILSTIPSSAEFDGSLDTTRFEPGRAARFIRAFSEKEDIPYIDLYGALQSSENPMRVFMHWEFHFNEAGHSFVANEVGSWVKSYILQDINKNNSLDFIKLR